MHQKHIVDFTPGRPHVEPRTRGKGHKGQPRSGWLQQLGAHDQLVQWLQPLTCPQWMDKEQCGHLPERLEVRELQYRASIMASASPFCFCTTQKHLTVER